MTREEASARIMEEGDLTSHERSILMFLVYRCNDDRMAYVKVADIYRGTGIDRRTVAKNLSYLADRQYLAVVSDGVYRPFPYVKRTPKGKKEHKTHNTTMSLSFASVMLADVTDKIAQLTSACEAARGRRDKVAEKTYLDQIDARFDIQEFLQNFIAVNRKDVIKSREYYESM